MKKMEHCMFILLLIHGIFDAEDRPSYRESKGNNPGRTISDEILNRFERVHINFKKGSMLVLHGNCIHGSKPNISKIKIDQL